MLDFLWSVPANQITGMSVVTYEHLEWIVEIKNWVLTSTDDMQIDPNNLQISMRAWLEARIDQYAALNNAKTVCLELFHAIQTEVHTISINLALLCLICSMCLNFDSLQRLFLCHFNHSNSERCNRP